MEPVRVKVYGLFPRTRRRYLIETAVEGVGTVVVLLVWWLAWPALRHRLTLGPLPPAMSAVLATLDQVPWILLAGALLKAAESYFVLRRFARAQPNPPRE